MPKGIGNESEGFILSSKRTKMKVYSDLQKVVSSNRNTNNIRTKCKVEAERVFCNHLLKSGIPRIIAVWSDSKRQQGEIEKMSLFI
ncbi:hypothetical protein BK136_11030 [Paenibacillus amylolyticus]|nr:hypothetical protein BK136_11030 [Paenibacillus amylolyticus]